MKAKSLVLATLLLLPVGVFAAAPPCVPATLQDYVALGTAGCVFNGVTFANFSYTPGASGVPATAVKVQLFTNLGTPELKFLGMWKAKPGAALAVGVNYTADFPGELVNAHKTQLGLLLGPVGINGQNGSASVDEITNVGNLSVFFRRDHGVIRPRRMAFLNVPPPSPLREKISNKLSIAGGDLGTTLTYFFNTFNTHPTF